MLGAVQVPPLEQPWLQTAVDEEKSNIIALQVFGE